MVISIFYNLNFLILKFLRPLDKKFSISFWIYIDYCNGGTVPLLRITDDINNDVTTPSGRVLSWWLNNFFFKYKWTLY